MLQKLSFQAETTPVIKAPPSLTNIYKSGGLFCLYSHINEVEGETDLRWQFTYFKRMFLG